MNLRVFDLKGREVEVLSDARREAGYHTVTWNATDFSSGVYFYRIQAGGFSSAKKMTLVR